jgi:glutamyl-tRNA synthetase
MAAARFGDDFDLEVAALAVGLAQERAITLVQIVDQMAFLFVDEADFEIAPESWAVVEQTDRIAEVLDAIIAHVESCPWSVEALALQPVTDALGIKFRKVAPAVYAVVEGVHRGLPLFDSMFLLGRERTLARLRAARDRLT